MIRAARAADAASIASIYNHYVRTSVITFEEEEVSTHAMSARIAEVEDQSLPWLVADIDGTVAGYAYANKWKARSAYRHSVETTIYLAPGRESRGLGASLYSALFPLLKARDIHVVIGGVALPNEASVALHTKLGFAPVGTFRQVGFKHGRWVDVGYWQLVL